MHGAHEWTPGNYEPDEQVALLEALRIQRTAELIAMTGWTFDQLERQPARKVRELELYFSMKSGVEAEKRDLESR